MIKWTYVEKLELVGLAANAVGEQEDIALLPRDFLGRKFVASSGGRHFGILSRQKGGMKKQEVAKVHGKEDGAKLK